MVIVSGTRTGAVVNDVPMVRIIRFVQFYGRNKNGGVPGVGTPPKRFFDHFHAKWTRP